MSRSQPQFGRWAINAFVIFGLWMIGGVLVTAHELWRAGMFGPLEIEQSEAVAFGLARGVIWAIVTPFIIYAAFRLPLEKPHRLRNALLLLAVAVFLSLARETFGVSLKQALWAEPWDRSEIFGALILRFDVDLAIILVIMAVSTVVRLQTESARRALRSVELEAEVARAQLRRLRADLHPHFLFNAMNGIASLVHSDPAAADRMLTSLAALLRRTLETREASHISLGDELGIANDYLELSRMRFGAQLTFHIDAAEDVLERAVPPLLLQPLVENAVVHGAVSRGGAALIDVRAFAREGRLHLEVSDNGPGCEPSRAMNGRGVGLPSTRARLNLMYGADATLSLRRVEGQFVVEVSLPLQSVS